MKRRHFLFAPFLIFPIGAFARLKNLIRQKKGIKVAAGEDRFNREIKFAGGNPMNLKVSGKDTDGDLCIFEGERGENDPKGGPPLHVHHEQDEIFYIVEGRFRFQVGDEKFELNAGDNLFAPRKVPHTFINIGNMKSKVLTIFQPAGQMEAYFQELGKFSGRPSSEQLQKLFRDHGMEIVGPRLAIE